MDSDEPTQLSLDRMRDCDLHILLVAAWRDHIPENETLSITGWNIGRLSGVGSTVLPFLYDGERSRPPQYYELDRDGN